MMLCSQSNQSVFSRRRSITDHLYLDGPKNHRVPDELNSKQIKKNVVHHNYRDRSFEQDDSRARHRITKGGVTVPFPLKLYDMLSQVNDDSELAAIVNWQPHGRCFLVRKQKEFAENILPRFFQQKKYASFQRQLNLYGFSRITRGPDRGSYYHEYLLRGKRSLSFNIQRMKIKGTGGRMASNPSEEPDFYRMPSLTDPTVSNSHSSPNHVHKRRSMSNLKPDRGSCQSNALVFDDMPFFPTESKKGSCRRHSLEDPHLLRRNSLTWIANQVEGNSKRNSITIDDAFLSQLESISSMNRIDNDEEMIQQIENILSQHQA